MASHTLKMTYVGGSGDPVSTSQTIAADNEINLDLAIADSTVDGLVNLTLDQSQMKTLFISSDQAVTLETNNGAAPQDTIALAADIPVEWTSEGNHTNPFSDDITALYVTNSSGSTANIKIRILVDATP